MANYYGPTLCHYGVEGMHWGIRRYQPYPKDYKGAGKFVGRVNRTMEKMERNERRLKSATEHRDAVKSRKLELERRTRNRDRRAERHEERAERLNRRADRLERRAERHNRDMTYNESAQRRADRYRARADRHYRIADRQSRRGTSSRRYKRVLRQLNAAEVRVDRLERLDRRYTQRVENLIEQLETMPVSEAVNNNT